MTTNNFLLRTFTALLGGTLFIFLLTAHIYTYYFLWALIALFCVWEWKNMFQLSNLMGFSIILSLTAIIFLTITKIDKQIYLFFYAFLLLFLFPKISLHQVLYTILGVIYLSVPLIVLYLITHQEPFYIRTLFVITIVWASDISAYLIGKYFGKHLLIPRISTKKTWEGLIGSFVVSAIIIALWFKLGYVTQSVYVWIGVLTAISTPVGDLIESAIKRSANVKDTSQLLPGHGGFLDRFDGFFFAIVVQYWI